jgi:hypothetical protein
MRRLAVACLVLAAARAGGAAPAARDDLADEAARLTTYAEGRAHAGDYAAAGAAYLAADAAAPLPARRCDAAVAYQRAGDRPRAAALLTRCLAAPGLDPTFTAAARAALATLTAALAADGRRAITLDVTPATATLTLDGDGAPIALGGGPLWRTGGPHTLRIDAAGFVARELTIDDATASVTVALARGADPAAPRAAARHLAIAATVVTALAGATAFGFYYHARGFSDDAALADTYGKWTAAHDDARTWNRAAWAMSGVAGAGALLSTYLWYRVRGTAPPVELAPRGDAVWLSYGRAF